MDTMMNLTKRIADMEIKQLILKNVNISSEILNSLEEIQRNTSSIGGKKNHALKKYDQYTLNNTK